MYALRVLGKTFPNNPNIETKHPKHNKSKKSTVFICTGQTPWLNGKHVVFGKVTSGMEVVRKIEVKGTEPTGRPKATVTIADCGVL